jgi:hypothetical protein
MHLLLCQAAVDFLHGNKLLHSHNLTRHRRRDGVENGGHTLFQAKGLENICRAAGKTDGGTEKGDAEEAHFDRVSREMTKRRKLVC